MHYVGSFHGSVEEIRSCLEGKSAAAESDLADVCSVRMLIQSPFGEVTTQLWDMPDVGPLPLFTGFPVTGLGIEGALHKPTSAAQIAEFLRRRLHAWELSDRLLRPLNPQCWRLASSPPPLGEIAEDLVVVIREHMLLEKLNIVSCLVAVGVPVSRIVYVGKHDRTLYRQRVAHWLEHQGVRLFQDLESFLQWARSELPGKRLVALDDGGDMLSALWQIGVVGSLRDFRFCETTTKGMHKLQEHGYGGSVTDLSSTNTKSRLSSAIAASCVFRLRSLYKHKKLAGLRCVVAGYGRIGEPLARLLDAIGLCVNVIEVDPKRRNQAEQHFPTFGDTNSALHAVRPDLFVGCAGRPSIRLSDVPPDLHALTLATVSSNDLRCLMEDLSETAFDQQNLLGQGFQFRNRAGIEYIVLGHGDAVNLFIDEGVSEPEFDDFNALSLTELISGIGAIQQNTDRVAIHAV